MRFIAICCFIKGIIDLIRCILSRNEVGPNLKKYTVVFIQKELFLKTQLHYFMLESLLIILIGIVLLFINNPSFNSALLFGTAGVLIILDSLYIKMITAKRYVELI